MSHQNYNNKPYFAFIEKRVSKPGALNPKHEMKLIYTFFKPLF